MENNMVSWPKVDVDSNKDLGMCFVCGAENPIGLKLKFHWDGKTARSEFIPGEFHQGWNGVVHGGIIQCLLDEAMSYATYFQGINCLTARTQVRLRRVAHIGEPLMITSSVTRQTRKTIETEASVALKDGTIIAEGTGTMYVFSLKQEASL